MVDYVAPIRDMQFVIDELIGLDDVAALPVFAEQDVNSDLLAAVLEEAGRLANEVLAPINQSGDQQGARLGADGVVAADGFKQAYQQFIDGGWNGLGNPTEIAGQGLPELINVATQEIWNAANMAFALCPILTAGAIESIRHHGSAEQQQCYLAKMVTGEWTGTMNLTEPQAGSDLSAVRTKAVPENDGDGDYYRLYGQKIYITWGDHDMTDNVIHLVLARTPDAPEGVKGISLFIVPKYLVNEDGSLGARNDAHCISLEHKLGIHASPTCVMSYGDNDGAIGYLVGEENKGLVYMFTMMNEERLRIGLQGVALGERSYQQAREYAKTRVQGRTAGIRHGDRTTIINHPDVRRMLLTMKAQNEAARALCYQVAKYMDLARHHPSPETRKSFQARIDLLIPVVKGWCTETSIEITSLGVQVHGGMGFVEETGAAQHYRDARITTIYEGTTGIQAGDLVGRKLTMDSGQAMQVLITDMQELQAQLSASDDGHLQHIHLSFSAGIEALTTATNWILSATQDDPNKSLAAAVNYMMLAGYVCGGWQMAKAALMAKNRLAAGDNSGFYEAKVLTAQFYAQQLLPKANSLLTAIKNAGGAELMLAEAQF